MVESRRIVEQGLERMRGGPIHAREIYAVPAAGTAMRIDAPRGALLHDAASDGTETPTRVKVRTPSFLTIPAVAAMVRGGDLAGVPLIQAAVDPRYSCTNRRRTPRGSPALTGRRARSSMLSEGPRAWRRAHAGTPARERGGARPAPRVLLQGGGIVAKRNRKPAPARPVENGLLQELVSHFQQQREPLRRAWVEQMTAKGLLAGLSKEEIKTESVTIYDTCVGCLATGAYESAQVYATHMAERGVLRGMTTEQIIGGLLTLRDVYGRSLAQRYQQDLNRLSAALDVYEPVANMILSIVALAFIEEREKVVREQQAAIRELSTPVLQVRDRLLVLPIIGIIDSVRARQITEQLLRSIRAARAKVVILDITGVPNVDSRVAGHLVQTVDAARLLGARVVLSGMAPEIAQTLVTIGVDLMKMNTVGDLEGALDEADRMLGYTVVKSQTLTAAVSEG
jgi:rsbT co-antagonist protein RsbR